MDRTQLGADDSPAYADAPLEPAPAAAPQPESAKPQQPPAAWIAQALIGPAEAAARTGLLYVASSERRADEIGRTLRQVGPEVEVLVLPPWDCLPFDRASPSREAMGRRMAVLARLSEPSDGPRVLVASVEALMQRIPPAEAFEGAFLCLRTGERISREDLEAFARRTGYVFDDRIDEPGEIAILGEVVDIFPPAGEAPFRVALTEDGVIGEIKRYDPLSQRTEAPTRRCLLGPASELILTGEEEVARGPGVEHRAPEVYGELRTVFDLLGETAVVLDPKAPARVDDIAAQVREAYEAHTSLAALDHGRLPAPDRLYLDAQALDAALAKLKRVEVDSMGVARLPNFALERNPGRAFADFVGQRLDAGARIVLAGLAHELRPLARALQRGLDRTPDRLERWSDLDGAGPLLGLTADLDAGFQDAARRLVVVTASDVLGGRVARRGASGAEALLADPDLRVGDVVLHEDHGLGVLRALERVDVDGEVRDAVRLEYHGGASLLVPVEEFGKLWRYGAEADAVTLDRLHTDAWSKRRVELSAEIDRTAEHLVGLAKARAETRGEAIEPPRAALARFAARFPYPETPDQAAAIEAVLADMASGRPMRRLVCGDVGFGKTEVALRAAAAAALAGKQVAVVAPTTVLARQHFETFRRRFAGFGIEVARLSRLATPAEARQVKAALADGSVGVVIGTHALAAKDVAFKNLGLLVIDEEQRFGAKLKAELKALAPDAHLLTMTATPIPRTLQLALVGVEDVSVLATPPARRRPVRTFLAPYDAATVRTALAREKQRGGQSFLVVPRIEDIGPMVDELERIAPDLTTLVAHGELPPEEVDEVMVAFAAGHGDVLLATNIIESGLDVPRANTMLVWRADRFGLAQLHQLRGRVGRGRTQGVTYLLTDPAEEIAEATRARLSTLVAFDRLGSGLAISSRDLEIRGAGDLIGEEQAGHMKLIGTSLYQRLLTRAVRVAKGEIAGPDYEPELNLALAGLIPESYVPDPVVRINLYARLGRMSEAEEVDAFAEELEDRFGPTPAEAAALLDRARIKALAVAAQVTRVDAGPKAVAATLAAGKPPKLTLAPEPTFKDGRILWPKPAEDGDDRAADVRRLLEALAAR
ncbi:transcription-repair coupling factor [Phenylobacterium sp.]|jgi:transcription-repair coupling factor (superfamily II helicase)|uniref:transcription-repair coupling factor n=1 Tax=Phenylobacterium sp. TaxID=1871053 RepID=UPI002F950A9F